MQPLVQSTAQTPQGALSLHVYPGEGALAQCAGHVYLDDGVSVAYQRGEFLRQAFSCASSATSPSANLEISFAQREGRYAPWWQQLAIIVHGWNGGATAKLNGKSVRGEVDAASGTLTILIPDQPRAATLHISH
jgi:alpha-glucosidase